MREMRRSALRAVAAALLSFGAASLALAQTVDELVAKNYESRGGLDKLRSLNTMKMTGRLTAGGTDMTMVSWMKRPNLMRQEMQSQGQKIVQAFDGTRAWAINPMAGSTEPIEVPGGQADMLRTSADFDGLLVDYKAKGNVLEIAGTDTMDGAKVVKLRVTRKSGPPLMLYLDATTGLERKMTTQLDQNGQRMTVESVMSNYKTVSGVQLPFLVQSFVNGQLVAQVTIASVEFNTAMDDELFRMPGRK